MKKKALIGSLFTAAIATFGFSAVACGNNKPNETPPPEEGPETGSYYFSSGDIDFIFTLRDGNQFSLSMAGDGYISGTYKLNDDGTFTFTDASGAALLEGRYANDEVTVTYNGNSMTFLRNKKYTVEFDTDGGGTVASVQITNGKTVANPGNPPSTPEGKVFVGWFTDKSYATRFEFGVTPVTSNITLYAKWEDAAVEDAEFTITLDHNHDGLTPVTLKTQDGLLESLPTPEYEGHVFLGWWVSQSGDPNKLSYQVTKDFKYSADTTLYARWEEEAEGEKLATPVVTVSETGLSWQLISGAASYRVEVKGPTGFKAINEPTTQGAFPVDFAAAPAGEYTITVTAISDKPQYNSNPFTVSYTNKALAQPTGFSVFGNTLVFAEVEHAEEYTITIDCGNKSHRHTDLSLGTERYYDFSSCEMQPGGIKFTVTAKAAGYAPSTSAQYVVDRNLAKATGFAFDEETEVLSWTAVPNATSYYIQIVSISGGETKTIDGTSLDLRPYSNKTDGTGVTVFVTPRAVGYNSPEAAVHNQVKSRPATPVGLYVEGSVLKWSEIAGATEYEIKINDGNPISVASESLNLAATISKKGAYEIKIRAIADGKQSLWSDAFTVNYGEMSSTVAYENNTVTWDPVVGAASYEVRVNNGTPRTVNNDKNSVEVTLDRAGNNKVEVRFFDGINYSEWVGTNVFAYSIEFDVMGGVPIGTVFKAVGDSYTLPDATRDGFDFEGWYNTRGGAAGNGTKYAATGTFTDPRDTVIFASWIATEYRITYDFGLGRGNTEYGTARVGYDFEWEIPTSEDKTLAFIGWYSRPNGKGTMYTGVDGKSINDWRISGAATVYAYFVPVISFNKMSDGTYSVIKGEKAGLVKEITVPGEYNGSKVRDISGTAFSGLADLEIIHIPDTVRILDATAFTDCTSLKVVDIYEAETSNIKPYSSQNGAIVYKNDVTGDYELNFIPAGIEGEFYVPDGVTRLTLGSFAENAKITKIVIPSSVKNVDLKAFDSCPNLEEIVFEGGGSAPLTIEDGAFNDCEALEKITLPKRINAFSAASIVDCPKLDEIDVESGGTYAATDGMLTSGNGSTILFCPKGRTGVFTVPQGVTAIGANAFENCTGITEVVIPATVNTIAENAFVGCTNITKITFKGSATGRELAIGDGAFKGLTKLSNIVFEANSKVTAIGAHAFEGCKAISSFAFPATLGSVGDYAFAGCTGISSIEFADSSTELSLGSYVFSGCSKLASVHLSASVKEFDATIVEGCNISEITVDANNKYFSSKDGILFNKAETAIKYVPSSFTGDANGAYTVPASVEEIGAAVFKGRGIKSVTIGANVTTIGEHAFDACAALTTVNFEASEKPLAIGDAAFYNCKAITTLEIPERTETIGAHAFYYVPLRGDVDLSKVTEIGEGAFYSCGSYSNKVNKFTFGANLSSVGKDAFKDGYFVNVEFSSAPAAGVSLEIGESAFNSSNLTNEALGGKLVLPSNLTKIGMQAFYGNKYQEVFIPKSVESLGRRAFNSCSNLVTVTFEKGGTKELVFEESQEDYSSKLGIFYNLTKLKYVSLPSTVKRIPAYTFSGCTALLGEETAEGSGVYKLFISNEVEYIGSGAFRGCNALTTVDFEEGEKALAFGEGAYNSSYGQPYTGVFSSASTYSNLVTVNLPKRLTVIPAYTFSDCRKLENVKIRNTVTEIGAGAFYCCYKLVSTEDTNLFEADDANAASELIIADGTSGYASSSDLLGAFALNYSSSSTDNLKYIKFPSRLKRVPDFCFYYNKSLTKVVIPATVANYDGKCGIGKNAFYYNSSITEVVFEAGASVGAAISFGDNAFQYCSSLATMSLPKNFGDLIADDGTFVAPALGYDALYGCSKLTFDASSIIYSDDKTELLICPNIVKGAITIPASVTKIADRAFKSCTGITSITFEEGSALKSIGANAFDGCSGITSITLPEGLQTIGDYAFYNCTSDSLGNITIPASVTSIGNYAFAKSRFKNVDFAANANITEIGAHAFESCSYTVAFDLTNATKLEKIGEYAFSGCENSSFTSISVRASVTEIGAYAFNGCSYLNTVSFAASCKLETIGEGAFVGTKLTEIFIPKSVVAIGDKAFMNLTTVTGVTFESGAKLETIGAQTFQGCTNSAFTSIVLPASLKSVGDEAFGYSFGKKSALTSVSFEEGSALVSIGKGAFAYTEITEITLPASLVSIGDFAFKKTHLSSVSIPANVESLGEDAFCDCESLDSVSFGANSKLTSFGDGAFDGCSAITTFEIPDSLVNIDLGVFYGMDSLEAVTVADANPIFAAKDGVLFDKHFLSLVFFPRAKTGAYVTPSSVISIDERAFENATALTSVVLSEGLADIGRRAFGGCTGITSVKLPDSLETIGNEAFKGCTELTAIAIPDNVTYIGDSTFEACSALNDVTLSNSLEEIGTHAFYNCTSLSEIYLPNSLETLGELTFGNCSALTSVRLPAGLTKVDTQAFRWCTGLESIELPNTVTVIENYAFEGCTSLKRVNIPNGVGLIGIEAFKDCAITEIFIPASVTEIRGRTFSGCSALETVEFAQGSTLAYLGGGSFSGCRSLTEISVPGGVGVINSQTFSGCSSLEKVTLGEGITEIVDANVAYLPFGGCTALATVELPSTLTKIGNYAFYELSALESITIPANVTSIGIYAFNKTGLKSVVIPEGITVISERMFDSCSALGSVVLPSTVTTINSRAFYGCASLMSFTVPSAVTSISTDSTFSGCDKLIEIINKSELDIVKGDSSFGNIAKNAAAVHSGNESVLKTTAEGFMFMYDETADKWFFVGYNGSEKSITLPAKFQGVSYDIFKNAFVGTTVEEVTVPEGVTAIGEKAFTNCSIEKITLPASLKKIEASAFSGTASLATVVFASGGGNLESIGEYAFKGTSITSFVIPGAPTVAAYAFQDCKKLTAISLGGTTSIGNYAFSGCGLVELEIPSTVVTLGTYAFQKNASLHTVVIGDRTTLSNYLFAECGALKNVTLPSTLTEITKYSFSKCESLRSIDIPDTVTTIGDDAFEYCSALGSVNISSNSQLTKIGSWAFYYCYSLHQITIPAGVTSIGSSAFNSCYKLIEIYNLSSKTMTGYGNPGYYAKNIYGADGSSKLVKNENSDFLFYIDGETQILVAYLGNETEIELPEKYNDQAYEVYTYAFAYNKDLTTVIVPGTITKFGSSAFTYSNATLFAKIAEADKPSAWGSSWNTSRPVVWGYDGIEREYTFDTNGGSAVESVTAKYLSELPEAPTKGDLIFIGWYDNAEFTGNAVSVPYCSSTKTTLYARFLTEEEYEELMLDGKTWDTAFRIKGELTKEVNISAHNTYSYFVFNVTEAKAGTYNISFSNGNSTPDIVRISDGDRNTISGYSDVPSPITFTFEAGKTYYVSVKYNYDDYSYGKGTVKLEKV